jgi:hypothetical protein
VEDEQVVKGGVWVGCPCDAGVECVEPSFFVAADIEGVLSVYWIPGLFDIAVDTYAVVL